MKYSFLAIFTLITLSLTACNSGNDSLIPEARDGRLNDAEAYSSSSPYAQVLGDCVRKPCSFDTLPLIGMDHPSPTIADIMTRVVVSDEWMGKRFEELLNELPSEMLSLFGSVTAIAIDGDIRPSYYTTQTAAIYLDPASLWLTKEEKPVINTDPDFRDGFSNALQFISPWRYVKDNDYAWRFFSLTDDSERTINDIILPMAQLLLHELSHANDFIPPDKISGVSKGSSPRATIESLSAFRISTRLQSEISKPNSGQMLALAQVSFRGVSPDATQKAYLADEVGSFLEPDVASDYYSYSTQFEDLAMLFEEVMMKHFFNIDRDIAFLDANDKLVKWGLRNRAGDPNVLERAKFLTQTLMPNLDLTQLYDTFPMPSAMPVDISWNDALDLKKDVAEEGSAQRKIQANPEPRVEELLRPYLLHTQ